ncbi:MAG: phage adaptor protein [Planctomycetota bacterium]|jgi:hypothetical protein
MSTYLELVAELHEEVGAAGIAPTAVTGQQGEAQRLVNWIKRADEFVQLKWVNWKFLRNEFTAGNTTTASVNTLAAPTGLKYWDEKTFKITYPGETEKYPLPVVEYDKIKSDILDETTESVPDRVILMPDGSLKFEPVPDGVYTIHADYYVRPTLLAASADVSAIPEGFHRVILGRAMILYANFETAPEIKDQGEEIYTEQLALLENDQLPNQHHSRFNTGAMIEVIAE